MGKQYDEVVTKLGNVILTKRSSFDAFKEAYETFAEGALIENDFYTEWYELLEKEKDQPVLEGGWQKAYYNIYRRMEIVLRDDYTEAGKLAKLPDVVINILNENMMLNAQSEEDRCFVFKVFTDLLVAFAEGDRKITYTAEFYKIVDSLCQEDPLKSFYGSSARETIITRTITAVFGIEKFGGETYMMPQQYICQLMVADDTTKTVNDFCRLMLKTDDEKCKKILQDTRAYSMDKPQASKTVVQDMMNDAISKKNEVSLSNVWTIAFGVLVVCIGIVAFSIGRLSVNNSSEIVSLESQVAAYSEQADSYALSVSDLEADNENLTSKVKTLRKKLKAAQSAETEAAETEAETESEAAEQESSVSDEAVAGENWAVPCDINLHGNKVMTTDNVINYVPEGEEVYVVEEKDADGWLKVTYEGDTGYINFDK